MSDDKYIDEVRKWRDQVAEESRSLSGADARDKTHADALALAKKYGLEIRYAPVPISSGAT